MARPVGLPARVLGPALATCVVAACAVPPAGAGVGGSAAVACAGTPGQLVVELVNGIRSRHDLTPFLAHGDLATAALRHSRDQASGGAMGHIGSDGSAPGDRLTAAGYPWALVSENVAAGYASASAVVSAWMDSPPHRATILSPRAIHAGAGYIHDPTAPMRHFWTLNVAAPRSPGADAALPCHP